MGLEVIYGKSRCGKTTYMFNKIKLEYEDNINKQIRTYVVVPEQFALSIEENLSRFIGKNGLFNVEVLTLKRMAYKVFNDLCFKFKNISDTGKKVILYNLLKKSDLKVFNSINKGNIENILDIFSEFDRYNIIENGIERIEYENINLEYKMQDLIYLYKEYKQLLNSDEIDSNTNLDILYANISNANILKNSNIFIDEFYGFTNQELKVITRLIEYNNVCISFCIDNVNLSSNPLDIYNINKQAYYNFLHMLEINNIKIDNILQIKSIDKYEEENNEINHLENNLFVYPYKKYEGICENIKLFACINPYTEIENLAQEIVSNVKKRI